MSFDNILIMHADTHGLDPQEDVAARLAAVCARLDLATGQLDAIETLLVEDILLDCRLTRHDEPADTLEALVAAGRAAGITLLAAHGAGQLAQHFCTLAGTLTPQDPRWVCTVRLAQHLWPDAPGHDLAALCHHFDLGAPLENLYQGCRGWDAACVAALLGRACRTLSEAGQSVTPALLRNWTEIIPLRRAARFQPAPSPR